MEEFQAAPKMSWRDRAESGTSRERETAVMSFRISPANRLKMEQAARQSGRSLARELEMRLEQSFRDSRLMIDALELAYGPEVTELITALANVIQTAAEYKPTLLGVSDRPALADPWKYDFVVKAIREALEYRRPAGEIVDPPTVSPIDEVIGTPAAQAAVAAAMDRMADAERNMWKEIAQQCMGASDAVSDNKPEQPQPKRGKRK